jgi:mono/diheme cytochrome c family protein
MKRKIKVHILVVIVLVSAMACKPFIGELALPGVDKWHVKAIPETPQVKTGDPEAGFNYLIYGDYIGSGIPLAYLERFLKKNDTILLRTGINAPVSYSSNAFIASNGIPVVSGNCFTCHAGVMDEEMVLGLGQYQSAYTQNNKMTAKLLNLLVKRKYGKNSEEWAAFENFGNYIKVLAPKIVTDNPGVNPAFRLEEACVAHRDPADLSYQPVAGFDMDKFTVASDVPPLWNVKKKNALYYNGMGRGDFSKLLMQASVLGIEDSAAARKAQQGFVDVYAWLLALEPPAYPNPVDEVLASKGKSIFNATCSKCHGTYGDTVTYPNKLVSLQVVKTDPVYARYFTTRSGLPDWYNKSWLANSQPASRLEPSNGYVAPPLDGVWATAPYLHNGSVPTLYALLKSSARPAIWKRGEYDHNHVGWKFSTKKSRKSYVTTRPGYGNQGHTFGDRLSEEERMAVIEYLKTL